MSPQSPGRRRAARASGLLTLLPFLLTPAGKIGVGATLATLVTGAILIGAPLGGGSKPIASHSLPAAPAGAQPIQPLAHSAQTDETPPTLEIGGVPVHLATGLAPDAQTSGFGFVPAHTPGGIPPSAGLLPVADFSPPAAQSVPAGVPEGGKPPPNIVTAPQPSGAPTNPSSGSTPPALPPSPGGSPGGSGMPTTAGPYPVFPPSLGVPPGSSHPPPVGPHLALPPSPGISPDAEGPNPPASPAAPPSPGETGIPAGPQPMAAPQPSPLASSEPSGHLPSGHLPSGHLPSGHLPSGHLPSGHLPHDTQPGLPSWLPPSASVPLLDETLMMQPVRQAFAPPATNTVPEPASLALLAAGLAGMMWMRRATSRLHRLRVG